MKSITKRPKLAARRTQAAQWFARAPVRFGLRCGLTFFCAMLLSALPLGDRPLPVAAGLVLALEFFPYSLLAALGALAGSVLFWPWMLALEPVAVLVLSYAAAGLFHDAGLRESERFASILSLALCAAVGFVFLLDQGFAPDRVAHFLAKLALAWISPLLFRRALLRREAAALWGAGLCLFVSAACVWRPVSGYLACALGYAVAIATGHGDILPTLLCGLGLELSGALPCPMCAPMAAAALLCRVLPRKKPLDRCLCFAAVAAAWQLLCGVLSLPLLCATTAGSFLGLLLPVPKLQVRQRIPLTEPEADPPLRKLAQVFSMMHAALSDAPAQAGSEMAQVYDAAAETVCELCVRRRHCWEQNAARTYDDLCAAAGPMLQRGCALREDFPPSFAASCCHMEGFLTAVNRALERSRVRRQQHNRFHECRTVVAGQYLVLARFLERLALGPDPAVPRAAFQPEFAVSGACRAGSGVSGDRGASFRDRWNRFYVLLCDGMGSGEAAAGESGRAVRTLASLLEAGFAPDAALELLNGLYILRESSAFSTVDLLQLDLSTGAGVLYKWGAAPSYLKTGDEVELLGTATPPPGLGTGPAFGAQQLRLSLDGGQTLIMVSDGAFGETTRQRARQFRGSRARDLAGYLVAGLREQSGDDLTAAVVRLLPAS